MPASLGSLRPGAAFAYLVEITNRSRSAATRRPTIFSLSPPVYILAVSMKLPPASTKASKTGRQSSSDRDQSAHGPKVMVQRADRKSVLSGQSVSVRVNVGGTRLINKKTIK